MISNPILEVSSTSPPASSSVKSKSSQGSEGTGAFDQFLTREIDRTRPQKPAGRSAVKNGTREVSAKVTNEKYTQTSAKPSYNTSDEDSRGVKSEETPAAQTTSQTNAQDAATLNAAAAVNVNAPATPVETNTKAAAEATGSVFQVTLEMLAGGEQNGEPPPEQAQGPGVVVEQPPPQTQTSEPARLAEAQPETKLPKDVLESQTISLEEFQNLLKLKQGGEKTTQTMPAEEPEQAPATPAGSQTTAQTGKASNPSQEQVAGTIGQSSSQAQAFLRSLQQYGQIKEVTLTQGVEGQTSSPVAAEKGSTSPVEVSKPAEKGATNPVEGSKVIEKAPANTAQEIEAGDLGATTQSTATPLKPALPHESKPAVQTIAAGLSASQQVKQPSDEAGVIQEKTVSQDQSARAVEGGQNLPNTEKKTNSVTQSANDILQAVSTETATKAVKPTPAKVETAPIGAAENATAPKASHPAAAMQSQSEGKQTGEGDLVSTNVSQAGDRAPQATVIETKSAEAAQQSSETRTVHRILQQTFNHLDNMAQNGQKTLRVQLYPENLGHLELRLTSQGGSLQVTILADSSVTQEALQQNARDLQQSLQQSGVNLTGLTVGHRGEQEQPSRESHRTYQPEHKTNNPATPEGEIEGADATLSSRVTYLNPYTSMEYRV